MELTDATFDAFVAQGIAVIEFHAPWCQPCQRQRPIVERLAAEHPALKVGFMDTDKFMDKATEYDVIGLPAILIFKDGNPVEQYRGFHAYETLEEDVSALLPKTEGKEEGR